MSSTTDGTLDGITRALSGIADTLETHTAMLEIIVEAATAEPPASELPATLKAIAARLSDQEDALLRIEALLTALPEQLARAIYGEVP